MVSSLLSKLFDFKKTTANIYTFAFKRFLVMNDFSGKYISI